MLSPWDYHAPHGHEMFHHTAPANDSTHDFIVKKTSQDDAYVVTCTPENGVETVGMSVKLRGQTTLSFEGTYVRRGTSYEYITRGRTGVYSSPNSRRLTGIIPAGRIVSGGAPSHGGWIALDDDESWIMDDGSLALSRRGRAASAPIPFRKLLSLPADAMLHKATSKDIKGGLAVIVPRRAKSKRDDAKVNKPMNSSRASPHKLTMEQLLGIQEDCLADDIPLEPEMRDWTEAQVREYFESGGRCWPAKAAHTSPSKTSLHAKLKPLAQAQRQAPSMKPPKAARQADFKPNESQKKEAAKRNRDEVNQYDSLLASTNPILVECTADLLNVQMPPERSQEWEATKWGGFVRVA